MRGLQFVAAWVGVLAFLAAGCAPPTVAVRHELPGALPLPAAVSAASAGEFTVRSGPKGDYAAFLKQKLTERLAEAPVAPAGEPVVVGGTVEMETKDATGKRTVRGRDSATGELHDVELPTLVRTASVKVDFDVQRAGEAGQPLGTAEVRRSYTSASDATVRGELGLDRPDDPARVPPAEEVIRHLLAECAEAFVGMIAPVVIEAQVPMRPVPAGRADAAFDAARKGDYTRAAALLAEALAASPDDPALHFNRALAAEAAGDLAVAAEHYQKAWDLSNQQDPAAQQGLQRARRVLATRKGP